MIDNNNLELNQLRELTKKVINAWENHQGYAPEKTSIQLDKAVLQWTIELTDCLPMWIDDCNMTDGKLILAYANLGAIVENWLKLFYCLYYDEYAEDKLAYNKNNQKVETPNKLSFERLKQISRNDILWELNDKTDQWVTKIQGYRNAIHAFNNRNLGTHAEFIEDVKILNEFVTAIFIRLPNDPSDYFNC